MSTERQNQFGKHCAHMRDTPNKKYVHKCRTNSHHHTPHQKITFNRNTPIQKSYALAVCRNSLKQKRIYVYINDLTLFLKYMCIEAGHCGVCEKKMLRYARLECVYMADRRPRERAMNERLICHFCFSFRVYSLWAKICVFFFLQAKTRHWQIASFHLAIFVFAFFISYMQINSGVGKEFFCSLRLLDILKTKTKSSDYLYFFLLLLCKYLSRLMRLPRPKVSGIKHARNEYTKKMFFYNMNWQ